MSLEVNQSVKSFQWVLYRWLDESLIEVEAISTTGSVKVWFLRACRVTSKWLGRTVSCPGETLDVDDEERTGTVGCPVKVSEDVGWVVGEWEVKTWMDSRTVSQWPACLGTFESWVLSELVETHTPNLNCPKRLTGRLPPMLSRPGRVTQRCETLYWLANMSTRGFPKTQNRLFKVSCGSRHSVGLGLFILDNTSAVTLRDPGKWVWVGLMYWRSNRFNSSTVLVNSPRSGATPFSECKQLSCCCQSTGGASDLATGNPNGEPPVWLLPSLTSLYGTTGAQ